MSKLSRQLAIVIKKMRGDKIPYMWRFRYWIDLNLETILEKMHYYDVKHFFKNLPFFLKQAWKFRAWDSHFNINLFADSLEYTAKDIKKYNNHYGSGKTYRRCMYASKLLKKAYNESAYNDASLQYWDKQNLRSMEKVTDSSYRLSHTYAVNKEYADKMHTIIHNRLDKQSKDRKAYAWIYISKHIEKWWD